MDICSCASSARISMTERFAESRAGQLQVSDEILYGKFSTHHDITINVGLLPYVSTQIDLLLS